MVKVFYMVILSICSAGSLIIEKMADGYILS